MLIILYGDITNKNVWKHQRMIDGGATCGYREYARNFGHIIYMSPQRVKQRWEHVMMEPKNVIKFINKHPNAIVWSVKHSPNKDQKILSKIPNKKLYYSCNSNNMYNKYCDVSLVDTSQRVKKNAQVWFKGKDPNYWRPLHDKHKEFSYVLLGRRGDKNEIFFLNQLNSIKKPRTVLWIGGKKHEHKIRCNHRVTCTEFVGQDQVRDLIPLAKIGVLFTELQVEGFPQSFLEMTMCGVPVVYNINGPINDFYFHKDNCILSHKGKIVKNAEDLLEFRNQHKCRLTAIKHYSLDRSYGRMRECLGL